MFDDRLSKLREDTGLSRKEIAIKLNMPYTTYLNYENNEREPNSETLIQIAKFFNVSIDYLLGVSNIKTSNTEISNVCKLTKLSEDLINMILNEDDEQIIKTFDILSQQIFYSDLLHYTRELSLLICDIIKNETSLCEQATDTSISYPDIEKLEKENEIRSQATEMLKSIGEYAIFDYEYLDLLLFKVEQSFDNVIKLVTGYCKYENEFKKL